MSGADPEIEAFFTQAPQWRDELVALREILRDSPLTEELKWGAPCYTFEGSNVAILGGYKERCVLSFFKGVLLEDPAGILVPPGENTRSGRIAPFTSVEEIAERKATLEAYILEAVEVEKAGLEVDLSDDDLDYPQELVDRLEADPELAAAFEALTLGRRRGYVLHVSQAKQSTTRAGRIDKHAPRILEGKGMHDR